MNETNLMEQKLSNTVPDQKKTWVAPTATIEQVKTVTQNGFLNPGGDGITLFCHS